MIEKATYKGEWFLPSDKSKRIKGILSIDSKNASSLELLGNFEDGLWGAFRDEDIILGITSDSKEITLYRCFLSVAGGVTLVSQGESGIPSTIYTVNFIVEGVHADTREDLKFETIIGEILHLDEWLGISGFLPRQTPVSDQKNFELNIQYKLPEQINFAINDNLTGQFNFVITPPSLPHFQKSISLNQRAQIVISSAIELTIEDLLKHLIGFQNFLILALYDRTYPTAITLRGKRFQTNFEDGSKPIFKKVKLHFAIANRTESIKSKSDLNMLFAYGHIKDDFSAMISNWYKKYESLEPAFNLLFEQFYNSERFTENTFLNLAQAAETFHARTNNHTKMPKKDFDEMKEKIYESVPKQYHAWLKDQFNFGNNLNLHTRLTEIVSKYSNEMLDKLIGDKEVFVKKVKWSRNYYTHYSSGGESQALKGQDLFFLTEKLKIVLVCVFLIEIGFDNQKLNILLDRNKNRFFHQLIRL